MRRRDFVQGVAATAACPVVARAQQSVQTRRIGVLIGINKDDPEVQVRYAAFLDALRKLGWVESQNLRVETRWAAGDLKLTDQYAAELIALAPDVIVTVGSPSAEAMLKSTSTVPIVFTIVLDPVGAGWIKSLSRPGGNATGFMQFEYSLSAKWPELLKQIAPGVKRVAVLRDRFSVAAIGQFAVIESVAPSVGVEAVSIGLSDPAEFERDIEALARSGDAGLIAAVSTTALVHRDLLVMLALRHKLPAVYCERTFATAGGLISYGPNYLDQYRSAAAYVDRVLRGERPADLPVQAPTKYELVVNLKTARLMGLTIPPPLLASADEVIE